MRGATFVVFVSLAASAGACVSGRMMVPGDVVQSSEQITVTDRSRASGVFINEGFNMGPYQIVKVHRTGEKSSGGEAGVPGLVTSSSYQAEGFYSFEMKAAQGVYTGNCGIRATQQSTRVLGVGVQGHASSTVGCNCSGGAPGVISLVMDPSARYAGEVVGRGGGTVALQPVYTWDDGKTASPFMTPIGWEVRGNMPMGAVEVYHPGRVFTNRGLDPLTRADLACLFVGLLLYRPLLSQ